MIHHYIEQEEHNGNYYAVSWIEINIFRYSIVFSKRKIRI